MEEIWKDVVGFEGLYQVSNLGRVKSFRKPLKLKSPDEYILKNYIANNGYVQVTLYGKNNREKRLVHRMVAEAFIPNPSNLPQVNHIDENPSNNCSENLEWCTARYNNEFGTAQLRMSITKGRMIDQFLPTGEFVARYSSIHIASKITGHSLAQIKNSCYGHAIKGGNYVWRYVDEEIEKPKLTV